MANCVCHEGNNYLRVDLYGNCQWNIVRCKFYDILSCCEFRDEKCLLCGFDFTQRMVACLLKTIVQDKHSEERSAEQDCQDGFNSGWAMDSLKTCIYSSSFSCSFITNDREAECIKQQFGDDGFSSNDDCVKMKIVPRK